MASKKKRKRPWRSEERMRNGKPYMTFEESLTISLGEDDKKISAQRAVLRRLLAQRDRVNAIRRKIREEG